MNALRSAAVLAALILATPAFAIAAPVVVHLSPQNHSGETATAKLTEAGGNTTVTVVTKGGPANAQPIHIHKGTCAKLDPKPFYPLTTLQGGKSVTTLKGVTLMALQNGDFAINIHHSTSDIPTYYACGNIAKMAGM